MNEESFKERRRKSKDPLQCTIYKGVTGKFGAMRISLKKAYTDTKRDRDEGCVFIEACGTTAPNNYDWENKIVMALNMSDIAKILLYLRTEGEDPQFKKDKGELKIFHDRGAGTSQKGQDTTSLNIKRPEGWDNLVLSMHRNASGESINTSVSLSSSEAIFISVLLQAAIPLIVAWN